MALSEKQRARIQRERDTLADVRDVVAHLFWGDEPESTREPYALPFARLSHTVRTLDAILAEDDKGREGDHGQA